MPDVALRLLTFNVLFKQDVRARLRALGHALNDGRYDIVCLQEVVFRHNLLLLRRIARSLPYCGASGGAMLAGGLAILSRWPITDCRFTRYPVTKPVRPEWLMRKGAQLAMVRTPGGALAVVNTHLSANRDDDWSTTNRYAVAEMFELRRLAGLVATISPAAPLVAMGDFNVPGHSSMFTAFTAAAGLRDPRADVRDPTYRPTPTFPKPPDFDHVLVRPAPDCDVTADTRLVLRDRVGLPDGRWAYLSDHYGIETELTLSRRGAQS